MKIRPYKSWPGESKFICNGRMMVGPDWYRAVITSLAIGIPMIFELLFPCWHFLVSEEYVPFVLVSVLGVCSEYFLFQAATSDPGFIPKQVSPFANAPATVLNEHIVNPRPFKLQYRGASIRLKFCQTCMIFRPPRSSHCSVCDLCVEYFDHHCPWIGNCVGRRNYGHFIRFVFVLSLLAPTALGVSAAYLIEDNEPSIEMAMNIFICIYAGVAFFFLWGLLLFHVAMVFSNSTTNESIKKLYGIPGFSPFRKKNCFENFYARMDRGNPQYDAGEFVSDDDVNANFWHRKFHVSLRHEIESNEGDKEESSLLRSKIPKPNGNTALPC